MKKQRKWRKKKISKLPFFPCHKLIISFNVSLLMNLPLQHAMSHGGVSEMTKEVGDSREVVDVETSSYQRSLLKSIF